MQLTLGWDDSGTEMIITYNINTNQRRRRRRPPINFAHPHIGNILVATKLTFHLNPIDMPCFKNAV